VHNWWVVSSDQRSVLFWVMMQRVVVISYRRLGTTYWTHHQGSRVARGCDRFLQNVGKK